MAPSNAPEIPLSLARDNLRAPQQDQLISSHLNEPYTQPDFTETKPGEGGKAGGAHRQAFDAVAVVVPPRRRAAAAGGAWPRRVARAVEPPGSGHGPFGRAASGRFAGDRVGQSANFASPFGKGGGFYFSVEVAADLGVWDGGDGRAGDGWRARRRPRRQNKLSKEGVSGIDRRIIVVSPALMTRWPSRESNGKWAEPPR